MPTPSETTITPFTPVPYANSESNFILSYLSNAEQKGAGIQDVYYCKNPNTEITKNTTVFINTSADGSNLLVVPTFEEAIATGIKNIEFKSDYYGTININDNVIINGNGYTVYGDVVLTTEAYNSILRAPYTADTRITNCFVGKTTPLTETASGSDWKGDKYNITCYADDLKLLPVEDVATCESTDNSCTWYDGYFYINATGTRFSYVTLTNCITITKDCTINRLKAKHCYSNIIYCDACNVTLDRVIAIGSVNSNCVSMQNGNLVCRNIETAYCWNDGINIHSAGNSEIVDCYCHNCSDDGISQHDTTTGVLLGGEFSYCGKGGISTPINSAKVDIYNAYCHHNDYGIYASSSYGTAQNFNVFGCVVKENRIGLKLAGHTVRLHGNKIVDNTTSDISVDSGTVVDLDI